MLELGMHRYRQMYMYLYPLKLKDTMNQNLKCGKSEINSQKNFIFHLKF